MKLWADKICVEGVAIALCARACACVCGRVWACVWALFPVLACVGLCWLVLACVGCVCVFVGGRRCGLSFRHINLQPATAEKYSVQQRRGDTIEAIRTCTRSICACVHAPAHMGAIGPKSSVPCGSGGSFGVRGTEP